MNRGGHLESGQLLLLCQYYTCVPQSKIQYCVGSELVRLVYDEARVYESGGRSMMRTVTVLGLWLCVLPGAALALETAAEIQDCIKRNLPKSASEQEVVLRSRDRGGEEKTSNATIHWKKFPDGYSKVLLRVSAPPNLRGTGLLMIEKEEGNDRFLYMPSLKKVRRITQSNSSGSVLGTDFSYEDLERLQGISRSGRSARRPDDALSGHAVYVLESWPDAQEDSAYERSISYVDQQTCVILKSELFEYGDRVRKTLTADPLSITQESGLWVAHKVVMEDLLEGSSTDLVVEALTVGEDIPDSRFTRKELSVGRR